jgi:E3 ubiquitin-protein ligase SHPRH
MAMATVGVQADVFEVQPFGHVTGESSPDPIATILRLFKDGSETSGTEERPQKKRKLDNGNSVGLQPAEPFDGGKSALLAGISIDLVSVLPSTSLCSSKYIAVLPVY